VITYLINKIYQYWLNAYIPVYKRGNFDSGINISDPI